jgi:2-polyprenyl-3-methyl-5-hydroxy-6-metoxy-1,4-benzoquinol methylase
MGDQNDKLSLNYSALAILYDTLMKDVDYESWADYIDEIIQTHHPTAEFLLELACGTGSIALSLDELGYYTIDASDISREMLEVAIHKSAEMDSGVNFFPMSFQRLNVNETYDVVFSVFDSINYLTEPDKIKGFLQESVKLMDEDGLLIFDFATPKNSLESVDDLDNDQEEFGNYRFFRKSSFDIKRHLHYNHFEIERLDPDGREVIETFTEIHCQRVYTLEEMKKLVEQSPWSLIAAYGDFELTEADDNSSRITLVLTCQNPQ